MARIRTIKPDFFSSPSAGKISYEARLLYIAMWQVADDWGVGEANPKMLAAYAFPYDEITGKEIPCLLKEIADAFNVVFYSNHERAYFQILNWEEHQVTQRKAKRKYPTADDEFSAPIQGKDNLPCVDKEFPCGNKENTDTEKGKGKGTGEYILRISAEAEAQQENKPAVTSKPKPTSYSADFLEFWDAYPLKRNKRKAWTNWQAAIKRAEPATIIAGARAYAAWVQANPEVYVKYPEGWLTGDRWEDDLTATDGRQQRDTISLLRVAGDRLAQFGGERAWQ